MEFSVWVHDEPEFLEDAEYKFNILTHPVRMALGTHGKNDYHAREAIRIFAPWALRKLFIACVKVAWWCGITYIERQLERMARWTSG